MEGNTETAATRGRAARPWIGLLAILILYCGLAGAQSFATRLQWGPDEPAHIIYLRSLAMDGRLPALTHAEQEDAYQPGAARSHQAHHPPLYYLLAAPLWRAFSGRADETVTYLDARSGDRHSFRVPGPVRPVRFLSILLGALTLLFTYAAARTVFPDRPAICLGGVALVAFTPMFTYVSGVINNDSLLGVMFAATAWQWARIMRFGAARRDVVLLGLLVGAAINVKETGLGLAALSVVVLALEPGAASRKERAARIAIAIGLAAALGGWWYLRKLLVYGSPFIYAYHYPLLDLPPAERRVLIGALPGGVFLFTFMPWDVISRHVNAFLVTRFFGAVAVCAAGGLALSLLRGKKAARPRWEGQSLALWLGAAALVLAGVLRLALTVDWRIGTNGGRLMVAVLPLLALAGARGLSALFGEGRRAGLGLGVVSALMLAMNCYAIWATAAEYGTLGW